MRSQTTLQNSCDGFLLFEVMIAFSLMTLFLVSSLALSFSMQALRLDAVERLENLDYAISHTASTTLTTRTLYGNHSEETYLEPITILSSDYESGWGRDSCSPRFIFHDELTMETEFPFFAQGVELGVGNVSTDLEVRNGFVYLTADSSTASAHDLYIIDATHREAPIIISSVNTGPGLSSLEVVGAYIFAGNLGTTNQLQVIDIRNRLSPTLLATLKLPLPTASSSPPTASAIFYHRGYVYLGTTKWEGGEFAVIDVRNPSVPTYVGGFEVGTIVNDIYVQRDRAYLGASDVRQLLVLDVSDPTSPSEVEVFSPSGFSTQHGETLAYFEDRLAFGRTTGGFNIVNNHEVFHFSTTSPITAGVSRDIPGGVYGIVPRPPYIFLATRSPGHEFQIWSDDLGELVYEKGLGFLPQRMACDGHDIYFATGDSRGIAVLEMGSVNGLEN